MSSVSDKLSKFLENAFKKAFVREVLEDNVAVDFKEKDSFLHETIEDYKASGYHFRRTKDQMSRGLTREEAFEEFKKEKKNL